jgi:hypothetical protein
LQTFGLVGPHFSATLTKNRSTFRSLHIKAVLLRMPPSISINSPSPFFKSKTNSLQTRRPCVPYDRLAFLVISINLFRISQWSWSSVTNLTINNTRAQFKSLRRRTSLRVRSEPWAEWEVALRTLKVYEEKKAKEKKARKGQKKGQKDPERTKLLDNVKTTRAAMDAYNQYTVNVRGASPTAYGSLKEANIVSQFATLIKVTMPSPTAQETILQHMRPLERLGEDSAYTAWMTDYGTTPRMTMKTTEIARMTKTKMTLWTTKPRQKGKTKWIMTRLSLGFIFMPLFSYVTALNSHFHICEVLSQGSTGHENSRSRSLITACLCPIVTLTVGVILSF